MFSVCGLLFLLILKSVCSLMAVFVCEFLLCFSIQYFVLFPERYDSTIDQSYSVVGQDKKCLISLISKVSNDVSEYFTSETSKTNIGYTVTWLPALNGRVSVVAFSRYDFTSAELLLCYFGIKTHCVDGNA